MKEEIIELIKLIFVIAIFLSIVCSIAFFISNGIDYHTKKIVNNELNERLINE